MARTFPASCPPAPADIQVTRSTYEIRLITPLFGGGVQQRKADSVTPVRGMSIRGQLRFWWRATRGRNAGSSQQLWERESTVWGNTQVGSPVRIEVELLEPGTPIGAAGAQNCPKYVLFPFKEEEERCGARKNVHFRLHLTCPANLQQDVEAAVWAWTNFGGLGSRTRRGCGALFCVETAPARASELQPWWTAMQARCTAFDAGVRDWPVLGPALMTKQVPGVTEAGTLAAWNAGINGLRDFRQAVGFARRGAPGDPRPGRSLWPESDSLRARTGQGDPRHFPSCTIPNPRVSPAFPRAALGLPIVFQFPVNPQDGINEGSLEPARHQRMASPLILRSWRMADGHSLALVLPLWTKLPAGLCFHFKTYQESRQKVDWTIPGAAGGMARPDLASYAGSPLHGRTATGNALEAAVLYFHEHGFSTTISEAATS